MQTLEHTSESPMESPRCNPTFQPWLIWVAVASLLLMGSEAVASKRSDCTASGGTWVAVWKCSEDCDNNGHCYKKIGGAAFPWPPPPEPVVVEALDAPASIVTSGVWNPDSSVEDAFAFAVGQDAPITTLSRTVRNWNSKAVSRAEWDSGFDFPASGAMGLGWTIPNTVNTFDTFFGPALNQVLVFWADDALTSTPIGPGEFDGQFYTGPAAAAGGAPYVIFTDGDVLGTGQTLEMPPSPFMTFEPLPEPAGTTASEVSAIAIREEDTGPSGKKKKKKATGRVRDESGVWRAAVWSQEDDDPWTIELLPADPTGDSGGNDVSLGDPVEGVDVSIEQVIGSKRVGPGASEAPAGWVCTGDPCTWTAQTVVLPAGATGGRMNWVGTRMVGGTSESLSGGSVTIPDPLGLARKACVWTWDGSAWQPTLLPELSTVSLPANESYGHMEDIAFGVAQDDSGNDKPVAWFFDDALQSWSITELPLPPGATQGAINDGTIDVEGTLHLAGSAQITGGGGVPVTRGIHEVCNGSDDDCGITASWTVTELGALPGFENSAAGGTIKHLHPPGASVVGSSDDGAGNEVGTLWQVDTSVTPPKVSIFDANNFAPDVTPGSQIQALRKAKDDAKTSGGSSQSSLVVVGTISTGPGPPSARDPGDPHAFVMTEVLPEESAIPTVSEWGLAAMTLLILTAGTLAFPRRGSATPRPTAASWS